VSRFAKHICVSRVTLSRIVNGRAGITADMALRLSLALGTTPAIWMDLQTKYDLWQAKHKEMPKIQKYPIAAS
jgi:addiction module HigA family antidote